MIFHLLVVSKINSKLFIQDNLDRKSGPTYLSGPVRGTMVIENLHLFYHYDHRYPSSVLAKVHALQFDRYFP